MSLNESQLRELSSLIDTLQSLPEEEQVDWLAQLPAEQGIYRPTLERLLKHEAKVETAEFLLTLPKLNDVDEHEADGLVAGMEIGPYHLIRELGRGGMGMVWLAERSDGTLKRAVALKLPHSTLPQRQLAERFARERDILAALTHPHIARLYDAGVTTQGQPYLALEVIEGTPLTAHCDAHMLTIAGRLALFEQVLSAVQYAHSQLVVHRDLKPANILVTQDSEVKLLDFGIAKLLIDGEAKETELTQAGGRALTPDYASPEQIAGGTIGTASDVYALGVVLYELLTGSRPYRLKRDTRGALEEAILNVEPVRSSQVEIDETKATARSTSTKKLIRQLAGDLDTIILKALKKNPAERYGTVDAFAQDLARYQRGEAVLARPDGVWYRASKFLSRNWISASAVAAVVVALATGLGIALWQANIARQEARTAKAVQDFLEDIFQANTSNQSDPKKARLTTARELLDIGAARIDTSLNDSPKAKAEVLRALGDLHSEMGLREKAIDIHRKRLAAVRHYAGVDSLEIVDVMLALCTVMGRGFTAADMAERKMLVAEAERILDKRGDTHSIRRARLHTQQSWIYLITDVKRANESATKGVAIYRAIESTVEKVEAITSAAVIFLNLRRPLEAKELLKESLAAANAVGARANAGLPLIYVSLGMADIQLGDFASAITNSQIAFDYSRQLNGENDATTIYAQKWLGEALVLSSRHREAIDVLQAATHAAVQSRGADDVVVLPEPLYVYGIALSRYGRIEEGFEKISRAIDLTYPRRRDLAGRLESKAALLTDFGKFQEAEALYVQAMQDREQAGTAVGERLIEHWISRTDLMLAMNRTDECLQRLLKFVQIENSGSAMANPKLLLTVARAELALGNVESAEKLAEDALEQLQISPQRTYRRDVEAELERHLGKAKFLGGRSKDARAHLIRAAKLFTEFADQTRSPKLADVEVVLGQVALDMGQRAAAEVHLKRAQSIYQSHPELGMQYLGPLRALRVKLNV